MPLFVGYHTTPWVHVNSINSAMFRFLVKILIIVFLLAIGISGGFYWYVSEPLAINADRVEFHIAPGSGMRTAAREIVASGINMNPWALIALARLQRVESSIKAGSYEIARGATMLELLRKLTRGDVTQAEIAFIEGWTFRQMREKLNSHPDVRHDSQKLSDAEIMQKIGSDTASSEGFFFPDTYLFPKRDSDINILARAHRAMQRHLAREWEGRDTQLPLATPYQALILASIIEKETGQEQDRATVASVFVNRLRRGMLLQTDPTVIYGLGERFDGNLRKRDLLADTPYNTYTRAGLPPTPIAMPGLASLQAALHPAPGQMLYFVSRGDGSSHFSGTLEEHNRAVNRYQRGNR